MQVTGSNHNPKSASRLSIRLTDGQSLLNEVGSLGTEVTEVIVELYGPVVTTYPKALEEGLAKSEVLTRSGIALAEGDQVVCFGESRNIGYVARLSAENSEIISEWRAQGTRVTFTSPLERCVGAAVAATRRSKNVHIHILGQVASIAYAEEMQLRYAEVVPFEDEGAMVNILALLNKDYDLRKAQFVLGGEDGKKYYKTLKEYFRRVECEK